MAKRKTGTPSTKHPRRLLVSKRASDESNVKKAWRRRRSGTWYLRRIRRAQRATGAILPYAPFARLIATKCDEINKGNTKWKGVRMSKNAAILIKNASEDHILRLLASSVKLSCHADRLTVLAKDAERADFDMKEDYTKMKTIASKASNGYTCRTFNSLPTTYKEDRVKMSRSKTSNVLSK